MPPMPPWPPGAEPDFSFAGISVMRHSVVSNKPAIEAAFCSAARVTFFGSTTPAFNVSTGEYEDLVKAGVVDPKKVTRAALQNAGSIAGLVLTTEWLSNEIPAEEQSGSAPGGQGG